MLVLGEKMFFVDKKITSSSQLPCIHIVVNISSCNGMNKNCFLCMERLDDNANQF